MLIDTILFVLSGVLRVLLLPLEGINIGIDFLSSIPFVAQFFQVIAYIIPWTNLMPLFMLVFLILSFKFGIAILRTIKNIVPFL